MKFQFSNAYKSYVKTETDYNSSNKSTSQYSNRAGYRRKTTVIKSTSHGQEYSSSFSDSATGLNLFSSL